MINILKSVSINVVNLDEIKVYNMNSRFDS